jgi:hypothetical protein
MTFEEGWRGQGHHEYKYTAPKISRKTSTEWW